MTKKRFIKLLMGRVKLSRDSARLLSKVKAVNVPNAELYDEMASYIPKLCGNKYTVAHFRRTSYGFKYHQ